MHNHDDKYPARPGFELGTSRLQAPAERMSHRGRPWKFDVNVLVLKTPLLRVGVWRIGRAPDCLVSHVPGSKPTDWVFQRNIIVSPLLVITLLSYLPINSFSVGTSESDVYRRQILTSKDDSSTEKIK